MSTVKIWIACVTLMLSIDVARAQQRTMAVYNDWTLSCTIDGSKSCGLVQVQKINGQSAAISQVGIGRKIKTDPNKISIEIIANVWMPAGVKLIASDSTTSITASVKWCTLTRCLADAELSDATVKRLLSEKAPGKLAYKTASQEDVFIPVSFIGFNEAWHALQTQ
jgi:invasion protein IalB